MNRWTWRLARWLDHTMLRLEDLHHAIIDWLPAIAAWAFLTALILWAPRTR